MNTLVSITSMASVSALGSTPGEVWKHYKTPNHFLRKSNFNGNEAFAAYLPRDLKLEIDELRAASANLQAVDDSVLYAIYASRIAIEKAGWRKGTEVGINIGSSRGATSLFEKHYQEFMELGRAATLSSPSTTLGNISSWVAQDLQSSGPEISHSVTCSTGLHAILNAVAWLRSGMAKKFLAGGSEAALTPFTMAQVQAMKINARQDLDYPCQALNLQKGQNSMVLGEAAAVACLEAGQLDNAIAVVLGIGYATEELKHSVSISANGSAFQKSMSMALGDLSPEDIDVVVMHAPGTIKGDLSEVEALKGIFGDDLPALTTNKWKLGHTYGASGILSLELAVMMLQHQEFIPVPYLSEAKQPEKMEKIMVNAVGFGGNAVSVIVALPQ
ncbi:beta-ketoacyl synthase N-terminal-like domain-containing protein [Salinimicrobium oceani]|uniref:Beta-ketoacyl synthase n=1 Tax=Salinimicrobium oceani TaxID=2722702 RepID=A0ABX1D362_9FLAO|nr:beta-ketoacyl synthase N-terminal-like domain-containing protein [Salinimicrobium oceani]NJW52961.1 beta-ketoacyl synthase [Salinimicrobium oceani]